MFEFDDDTQYGDKAKRLLGNYYILNRAVFYVSCLISSQKERDFIKTNYNDILGSYPWKGSH